MDVLLTHSNHLFHDRKQVQKMQPYPPLQTLLAAAFLRQNGLSVAVCDLTFCQPVPRLEEALRRLKPKFLVVCEDDFNFLTKMCLARNRELAFDIAQLGRKHGCWTVVHSSDASDHVSDYLEAGFKYVLLGEVEEAMYEAASGRPEGAIAGLAFKGDSTSGVVFNSRRPLRRDLDTIPSPAWDLIDIEPYRAAWRARHGYFSLNLVSSRGCPYHCNWCAKPVYGNNYRVRSPRAVAAEMRLVKERYQPDHIWFADDIFALSAKWTHEFSVAVQELAAQLPFKMQSRCDLMTRDTVSDLKRAGCSEVWMGAESGSQKILNAMDKGLRVDQIYQARTHLACEGIRVGLFLQFGYPGEGWREIEDTVQMVRETQPDDIGVSVSYPMPGTKFYQLVAGQIGKKANWTDSGDLSMMFRGSYSSEVYRALADVLHLEVRERQNRAGIRDGWTKVHRLRDEQTVREAAS